jgi:crotonobetainyl-CoA:carnitine CoA-transferase CaiB-like acyl-CoA transferase
MKRLGLDPERSSAERPQRLYVSLSGFGQSGPLAHYRAYANTVHAYGGLAHLTRDDDGEPVNIGSVIADPLSSLTAATVIAAWSLGAERRGGTVDLSMAEVVASRLAEFVAEAGASTRRSLPAGSERLPYAPHRVHPTADGRWIAIAVQSDAEWEALVAALDHPPPLTEPRWAEAGDRWEERKAIEAALDDLTRKHEADALFHRLQRAGVRACPVWTGADLIRDRHLEERGFFPEIDHPDPQLTGARLVGLAWRFVGEGPLPLGPPPRLGEYSLEEDAP